LVGPFVYFQDLIGQHDAVPTLLVLLFLILGGRLEAALIMLLFTLPLQGVVVLQNIPLPGEPDFSNEK
jgi:hypothetical protein